MINPGTLLSTLSRVQNSDNSYNKAVQSIMPFVEAGLEKNRQEEIAQALSAHRVNPMGRSTGNSVLSEAMINMLSDTLLGTSNEPSSLMKYKMRLKQQQDNEFADEFANIVEEDKQEDFPVSFSLSKNKDKDNEFSMGSLFDNLLGD